MSSPLHDAIERNLRVRTRVSRPGTPKPAPEDLPIPEDLPLLQRPKRGAPSPILQYPYACGQFNWTKRDWHRFQQACYAQGMLARQVLRILAQQYLEDYEAVRAAE